MLNVPSILFVFIFATVLVISHGNLTEENNVKLSNRSRLFSYEEIKNEVSGECCGSHSNCTVGVNGTECNCYFGFYEVNRTCQLCDCGANGFCEVVLKTTKRCTCYESFHEISGKCVALPQMAAWKIVVIVISVIILVIFIVIATILIKKPDWVENFFQRN